MKSTIVTIIVGLSFIWCGLVGGSSFIETPLKFKAPDVTLKIGVGIGMLVFKTINKIEIGMALAITGLLIFGKFKTLSQVTYITFGLVLSLLILQSVWLLPSLHNTAKAFVTNQSYTPNYLHHKLFVMAEICKVLFLIFFAINFLLKHLNNI